VKPLLRGRPAERSHDTSYEAVKVLERRRHGSCRIAVPPPHLGVAAATCANAGEEPCNCNQAAPKKAAIEITRKDFVICIRVPFVTSQSARGGMMLQVAHAAAVPNVFLEGKQLQHLPR